MNSPATDGVQHRVIAQGILLTSSKDYPGLCSWDRVVLEGYFSETDNTVTQT